MCVRYLSRGMVAVALALAGAGCSDKVKVKGVVTLDGNPVKGATVTFILDGGSGQNATGITQEDGSFRLTTLKENDGVNPGNYKVTVCYKEGVATGPVVGMRNAMLAQQRANQGKKPVQKYVIPPKYSEPDKTVLKQKVPPDGDVKLALQSK